jgi:glycerol-3-phosphate dehydrogenase
MSIIGRNTEQAEKDRFDLIIVGGGIYGAMLMLEAARAGLKSLLLEKADFGGGTSFNNLRIVHGGLRYLQTLHLSRIRESVSERRWFLQTFPEFVHPLPCLMPLYGGVTRNRFVLGTALRLNDWLSRNRNIDLDAAHQLPDGQVLSAEETRKRFPQVLDSGLKAGALWYDAAMPDCHRVQIEILRWCTSAGGTALNYVEATDLIESDSSVSGVVVMDHVTDQQHEFQAGIVINAAGPKCRALSARFDVDRPELFCSSRAWNLLLDRPPLSDGAVAIQPPKRGSRVYFAHSLGERLLVGTGHAAVNEGESPEVDQRHVDQMLTDLNLAVPGLELRPQDIVRLFSGQLPVTSAGTDALSDKPVILDHHRSGGPQGLFSVSGVKYTTARSTAAAAIKQVLQLRRNVGMGSVSGLLERPASNPYQLHPQDCPDTGERVRRARGLIETEAPQTLEDLLIRRSNLVFDPGAALAIADDCCTAFGWNSVKSAAQIDHLKTSLTQAATPDD